MKHMVSKPQGSAYGETYHTIQPIKEKWKQSVGLCSALPNLVIAVVRPCSFLWEDRHAKVDSVQGNTVAAPSSLVRQFAIIRVEKLLYGFFGKVMPFRLTVAE
jgi:hypothetical protein